MSTLALKTFVVQGEYLTKNSREMVVDGRWMQAIEFLKESLIGMTDEYAQMILGGSHKLMGQDPNITMEVEDNSICNELFQTYRENCFGGLIKFRNELYRPSLVVTNLGPEDVNREALSILLEGNYSSSWNEHLQSVDFKARETYPSIKGEIPYPSQIIIDRVKHYAKNGNDDLAFLVNDQHNKVVGLIFEKHTQCDIPVWLCKPVSTPQESMNLVGEFLLKTGCAEKYRAINFSEVNIEPLLTRIERQSQIIDRINRDRKEGVGDLEKQRSALSLFNPIMGNDLLSFTSECNKIRDQITDFANNDSEYGWHEFEWKDSKTIGPTIKLRAPKRALICYALKNTSSYKLAPQYRPFSPDNFKTSDDNVYHTDVWLGCGIPINENTYRSDSKEYRAIVDMMFGIQKELLNYHVQVLSSGEQISGRVVFHDATVIDKQCILILPHAGVEFEIQAMSAGAIICEQGGSLAHLVTVCREAQKPIVRIEGAIEKFKEVTEMQIDSANGRITVLSTMQSQNLEKPRKTNKP